MTLADRFLPNPDYGQGIYRRRIRLQASSYEVRADVFDDYHDMSCTMRHDDAVVTHVQAEIKRAPFSTCPGAINVVDELAGMPLSISRRQFYGEGRPHRNCTHIFDLVALAMKHALSGEALSTLDFVVPDLVKSGAWVEAHRDGQRVHRWLVGDDNTILAPNEYAGRSMFGGFVRWAESVFEGVALDLALHLQKVIFIARGRQYLLAQESENSIRDEPERIGVCYTFSEPQFSLAQSNPDYIRDFTDGLPIRAERL